MKRVFDARDSQVSVLNSTFESSVNGLFSESSTVSIEDSTFRNLGNTGTPEDGVCLSLQDSPTVTITNSTFSDNKGDQIGCVSLLCALSKNCVYSISDSTFSNNPATLKGGAIYYDSFRPTITNTNFLNNKAVYGENIAGYPVRIAYGNNKETSITYEDIASG